MTLFTKDGCIKCQRIKERFNLKELGIKVEKITPDDYKVLAHLAWHELVDLVEQGKLPILVLDDGSHLDHEVPIRRFLKQYAREVGQTEAA